MTDELHTVQKDASITAMIRNSTTWDYPVDLHAQICCELKINPRTWIVPMMVKELWTAHFPDSDFNIVEAFSDEGGNVVYFFDPEWSEQYRLWLVHHELFHQSQFYDKGNIHGQRWDGMNDKQRYNTWEREACKYGDVRVGKPGKDFKSYVSDKDVATLDSQAAIRMKLGRSFPTQLPRI